MSKITQIFKSSSAIIIISVICVVLSVIWAYPLVENPSELTQSNVSLYTITLGALIWMFCIPFFLIKKGFKENVEDFGWRMPENNKEAVIFTAISIVLLMPFLIYFSSQQSFQDYYQVGEATISQFILVSVLLSLVYYASEEFLFRGFLFFGLYKKIGKHSFWVTSAVFALLHISKPGLEVPFSFFASLLFCYLSYRTKSFVPAFAAHFIISLFLNDLIIFG